MYIIYVQSITDKGVSSSVKQCDTLDVGKKMAKECITEYVKQVYGANDLSHLLEDQTDMPKFMAENVKRALQVNDEYVMDNWEVDWNDNEDSCEIFVKPDMNSEVWTDCNEEELNKLYIGIKIAEAKAGINLSVRQHVYGFDPMDVLEEEDVEEDELYETLSNEDELYETIISNA